MKFTKTLIAAALLVGAGSANAALSINFDNSEAYMQAYDSVSKNTYSLDLGITVTTLLANIGNSAFTIARDLSTDANWTAFTAGFGTGATTRFAVAVGSSTNSDMFLTSSAVGGLTPALADTDLNGSIGAIVAHAQEYNVGFSGTDATVGANVSKLVNDGGQPNSGQFKSFDNIFGTQNGAQATGAYGTALAFFHEDATQLNAAGDGYMGKVTQMAGQWNLSGNSLTFGPAVSAVPLPAAVWMFGAGLMGMLRMNRRKSMAA
jgi:hypothetical protein